MKRLMTKYSKTRRPDNRNDEGTLTMFVMSLFVLLFVFGGMAVDMARLETKRVNLQNTLDSALFAVALNRDEDWTDQQIMDNFFQKAGIVKGAKDGADWGLNGASAAGETGSAAWARRDSPNLFLNLYGFKTFEVAARSSVKQRYTDIEISLVIDLSKSMEYGGRIEDLRDSAVDFAEKMFAIEDVTTHMSIIPFDLQANIGGEVMTAFHSVEGQSIDGFIDADTKTLTNEDVFNMPSHCFNFDYGTYNIATRRYVNGDFNVAALNVALKEAAFEPAVDEDGNDYQALNDNGQTLEDGSKLVVLENNVSANSAGDFRDRAHTWRTLNPSGGSTWFNWYAKSFSDVTVKDQKTKLGESYDKPTCRFTNSMYDPDQPNMGMLPFATTKEEVDAYLKGLFPSGGTASDSGLKLGIAMLDPSMRNTVNTLITGVPKTGVAAPSNDNDYLVKPEFISKDFVGRPANYDDETTLKVLVHMSDGENSIFQYLKPEVLGHRDGEGEDGMDLYPAKGAFPWPRVPGYLADTNISNVYFDEATKTWSVRFTDLFGATKYSCRSGRKHYVNLEKTEKCETHLVADAPAGVDPRPMTKREVLQHFTAADAYAQFWNGGLFSDIILTPQMAISGDVGNTKIDARFQSLCDITKDLQGEGRDNYQVYTIAFGAGAGAERVLEDCVSNFPGRAHKAETGNLNVAFDKIVGAITKLRLVN